MKKIIALLAGALCFGVVAAEAPKLELRQLYWQQIHDASNAPVEEVKAAVEEIKPEILAGNSNVKKFNLAIVETGIDARNSELTYADLCAKFDAYLAELKPDTSHKDYAAASAGAKIMLGHNYWTPGVTDARRADAIAALKGNEIYYTRAIGQLVYQVKGIEAAAPWFEQTGDGATELAELYLKEDQQAKAAELFWKLAFAGKLAAKPQLFRGVMAYEYSKEDFDAAKLKSKLTRLVNLYKINARIYKPQTDEVNPWLEFVGVLQDTVNGL